MHKMVVGQVYPNVCYLLAVDVKKDEISFSGIVAVFNKPAAGKLLYCRPHKAGMIYIAIQPLHKARAVYARMRCAAAAVAGAIPAVYKLVERYVCYVLWLYGQYGSIFLLYLCRSRRAFRFARRV